MASKRTITLLLNINNAHEVRIGHAERTLLDHTDDCGNVLPGSWSQTFFNGANEGIKESEAILAEIRPMLEAAQNGATDAAVKKLAGPLFAAWSPLYPSNRIILRD
jgi:hypothetical protein